MCTEVFLRAEDALPTVSALGKSWVNVTCERLWEMGRQG